MEYLNERGVNDGLLGDIDRYVGSYEHSLYLALLKDIKKFTNA